MSRDRAHAFSLIDLAVLLFLIALIAAAAMRAAHVAGHGSSRLKCASNLRQIGQAIAIYASENGGAFPRTMFDESDNPVPTEYTGANAGNPFGPDGPAPNDVSAPLFLLARVVDLLPEVFICPSSDGMPLVPLTGNVAGMSNFPGGATVTYGYTNPYPSARARQVGFKMDHTLSYEFAIAADIGPLPPVPAPLSTAGRAQMMRANSPNHFGEGQTVLYGDGHTDWYSTPYAGAQRPIVKVPRDNIYTYGAPSLTSAGLGPVGAPQDAEDTMILPHSTAVPMPQPATGAARLGMTLMIAAVGMTAAITIIAALWWRRRSDRGSERLDRRIAG